MATTNIVRAAAMLRQHPVAATVVLAALAISKQWPAISLLTLATLAIYRHLLGLKRVTTDLPSKASFLENHLSSPTEFPTDTTCIICRDSPPTNPVLATPCSHIFCQECLHAWFAHSQFTCPACARPLFTLFDATAEKRAKLLTALSLVTFGASLTTGWTTRIDYNGDYNDGLYVAVTCIGGMAQWLPQFSALVLLYVVTVREEWSFTTEDWWGRVDGHHFEFVSGWLQRGVLTGFMIMMGAWLVAVGWCWSVGEL
ncbi:hypothetical protein B0A55_04221 [Friedmanniomyces simplex]|uniref:RING-type domain-containing protein n=1 Tax=Friedmanniomyces simplex TaxID=329884 RepID=A0A4U0XWF6_9PEZI|nr:hypothetical protein B0A55_04221 [Friedmanniomyces simplex]